MTRRISYAIRSESGRYNATFRWDLIPQMLAFAARYWDIEFYRVNGGERFSIVQAAGSGPGWMWASKSRMRIWLHPSVNWGRSAGDCASALLHEFCHLAGTANHVADINALMHASGGICNNYIPIDYGYMSPYAWRGTLRPHNEPTKLRDTFAVFPREVVTMDSDIYEPIEGDEPVPRCGCEASLCDQMFAVLGARP